MQLTSYRRVDSPVGMLTIAGSGGALGHVVLAHAAHPPRDRSGWVEAPRAFGDVVAQLEEYFAGTRTTFDLVLRPTGTVFQRRVWDALSRIPYGETRTYGEIAEAIGQPGAARAVGLANGRNPIAIVVPCHRVIGADGSLTGYGGGLDVKRALLDLERAGRPGGGAGRSRVSA